MPSKKKAAPSKTEMTKGLQSKQSIAKKSAIKKPAIQKTDTTKKAGTKKVEKEVVQTETPSPNLVSPPVPDNEKIDSDLAEHNYNALENMASDSIKILKGAEQIEHAVITKVQKEKKAVKYYFTDEEKIRIGSALAMHMTNISSLKGEIKAFTSQKQSQIKQEEEKMYEAKQNIDNGYEYVDVLCTVRMNFPAFGQKSYFKPDGELLETCPMLASDYQAKIEFGSVGDDLDDDEKAIQEMDRSKDRLRG